MLAKVISAAVLGINAYEVQVEVDIGAGLPSMMIVGLPDAAVQESKERVRTAIKNAGLPFPVSRIVVNLAPADVRKAGPSFDLAIAIAILAAQGLVPKSRLANTLICGELALDGHIRPIKGAINIGLFAAKAKIKSLILPPTNASEAAVIDGIDVYAPQKLEQALAFLKGEALKPASPVNIPEDNHTLDFQDVKGQAAAKRALEIAAAGGHNVLMSGPPGSGKTMLARRLPSILPKLCYQDAIEVSQIHSSAGTLKTAGLIQTPPFRAPHHTVSDVGLIGGGSIPKPGEVSLAHKGVLFLDEFPEFNRKALEVLRQPLEDRHVTISRAKASLNFPASFMLVASQNPCPCGFYGDIERACSCTANMRQRYKDRISGPLLDRIDLRFDVPRLKADELLTASVGEASPSIAEKVATARQRAIARQGHPNASLSGQALRTHGHLTSEPEAFLRSVVTQLALSARGFDRILRVARTISDLAQEEKITEAHLAEAVGYRQSP